MRMEPQEPGSGSGNGGSAGRNYASIRQQQEEFRRRLMRPGRLPATSLGRSGDPDRSGSVQLAGPAEPAELTDLSALNSIQWTIQAEQVSGSAGEDDIEQIEEDGDDEEGHDGEEAGEEDDEEQDEEDEDIQIEEPAFDPSAVGLKEISNLASFTVSSYKPGCGVKELRDDDVNQFWQSDGPQPHRLNIHFIKRVEIRALRLYLDYELDESYTPTKIQITAGFSPNLTIPFITLELNMPKGWIDVPISGAGGGQDGNSLCCFFVRVVIMENHQNGKDTHLRGIKVYALDDTADTAENNPLEEIVDAIDDYHDRMEAMNIHDHDEEAFSRLAAKKRERKERARKYAPGDGGLTIPDFMREPEIR
ncbi:anaphase-promoting complex, subunit 10-domain-containing protein [Hypomontagnella monticulosa]|nr:anaphase-promoting complex, subunit 10-domain-containing protein [Hypomontagnella monticulosa]